jgi:hypothetical protein
MKTFAHQRNKYTGELYKFVRESVGDSSTVKYYFAGNIAIIAGIDKTQKMTIRADEPIAIGCLVANVKDVDGNLILDDTVWQISNLQPILNAFNGVEGYRMNAVKFQGTI